MRLVTFRLDGRERAGVRLGEVVVLFSSVDHDLPATVIELLAAGGVSRLATSIERLTDADLEAVGIPVAAIEHLPPIPKPGKIICIGRNYAAHAAEGGAETPTFPEVFLRGTTSLIAHGDAIVRPLCSDKLDYEGEFAFVIGARCRHASEDDALDFVAGYSLFNDATVRDYQRAASQWTVGKNFDGTGAFGPELVTADELPAALEGLTLTTHLNGVEMQRGHVDDLVFPVRKLIAILSECMTLEIGDVVVTGTPSGVGFARTPPVFMRDGDTVEVEVAGVGRLVNTVRNEV